MLIQIRCPSCGEAGDSLAEASDGVVPCPNCCAQIRLRVFLADQEFDDQILTWVSAGDDRPGPSPTPAGPSCPFCGYEGEIAVDEGRGYATCPACATTFRPTSAEAVPASRRVVRCPDCGRAIGFSLTHEDRDETILCPGCGCFLGSLKQYEPRATRRRG